MYSTKQLLERLSDANPHTVIGEEQVRRAIRNGIVEAPSTVAGRFVWNDDELDVVAHALGLSAPSRTFSATEFSGGRLAAPVEGGAHGAAEESSAREVDVNGGVA